MSKSLLTYNNYPSHLWGKVMRSTVCVINTTIKSTFYIGKIIYFTSVINHRYKKRYKKSILSMTVPQSTVLENDIILR